MSTVTASEHAVHGDTAAITLSFLHDWEGQGVAEKIDGRWRLTKRGRSMFAGFVGSIYLDAEDGGA